MNTSIFHYLFFLLGSLSCLAQSSELKWTSSEKLKWEDFRGSIEASSDKASKTFSGVKYSANILMSSEQIVIDFEVYAYFQPDESWNKPGMRSETLLSHEQGHFDISELHARLLRKNFSEFDYSKDFDKSILDELFELNRKERDSVQATYDDDTNHSLFKEGQALWLNFINDSIKRFDNYSNPKFQVVINLKE